MPALLDVTAEDLRASMSPIIGAVEDFNPLMRMIGNSHFVLIGEATHGTHEFYKARAEITKRLIREKGFTAVGVIYLPESERISHYFEAHLSDQFDAVFHFDETRAVEPLERAALWAEGEVPETYPSSF